MTKTRALIVVAALAAGGVATVRWQAAGESSATDVSAAHFKGRVWIDHRPRNERDMFHVFLTFKERPVGAFQLRSRWAGQFEAFRYEKNGNELRALFPQSGDRETMKLTITECKTDGMDYCLEIAGSSHGVKRYYSKKGWVIDRGMDADALLSTLP